MRRSLPGILLFLCFSCSSPEPPIPADLVLLDGQVWTVDANQPLAEAVAIRKDRILAVGSTEEIERLVGSETRVIQMEDKLVLPGFIDSHVHFLRGSESLEEVRLKSASSPEEFGRRLAEKDRELPEGQWMLGGTWDHDRWPDGELPTAELIDRYVQERPVFVTRYDGHMSVANTTALRIAGITADTPAPPGGVIVRHPGSREPTGVLKDKAQRLVRDRMPARTLAAVRKALEAGLAHAREVGVTTIQDVSLDLDALFVLQELLEEGKLTLRVNGHRPLPKWRELADLRLRRNFGGDWIKVGALKVMYDGSLGSSTALFFEPYRHDPSTSGVYVTQPADLERDLLAADRAGLQVAVHAIGDRANSELLDLFAKVIEKNGPGDRRFRIEHAQHISPEDFSRFSELGVIASVQPYHAIDDGRFAENRIGTDRCRTTYAFRTLLDHGAKVSFGSDWTVAPLNPILGIDAAVNRATTDGAHPEGWFPEQRITVEEAIKAYTLTSAYAAFDERTRGSITPGKLGDLVVLSQNLLTIDTGKIRETEVEITIVGGRVVYERRKP